LYVDEETKKINEQVVPRKTNLKKVTTNAPKNNTHQSKEKVATN
jgi:pantothenate kinase